MRTLASLALLALALPASAQSVPGIAVDPVKKTVTIDAKIAPRKLPHLQEIYPIEVVACSPHPQGKKAHETVVTIDVKPSDVHKALESLGTKPGQPIMGLPQVGPTEAQGPELVVSLEVPSPAGGTRKITIDRVLTDPKTNKPLPKSVKFRFTGSAMTQPDPNKSDKVYGADLTGTLIAVYPVTNETVVQTSLTMKEEKYLKLDTNKAVLPAEGTPVKLVLELAGK